MQDSAGVMGPLSSSSSCATPRHDNERFDQRAAWITVVENNKGGGRGGGWRLPYGHELHTVLPDGAARAGAKRPIRAASGAT